MNTPARPGYLKRVAHDQLHKQILPVWTRHAQATIGGIMSPMDAAGQPLPSQPKGSVMNSRALWSFSLLYALEGATDLQMSAFSLYQGFCDEFIDTDTGLVYWQHPVEAPGNFSLLAQTYAVFALSQFALASGREDALTTAERITQRIFDHFRREDGTFVSQVHIGAAPSQQDTDTIETCNQLHVLEALTQLYHTHPNTALKDELTALIDRFLTHIFPDSGDLPLLFSQHWQPLPYETSVGHNFEAPFLVALACRAIDDPQRLHLTEQKLIQLVDHSLQTAQQPSGYFLYGRDEQGQWRDNLTWWTQVEAVNALQWAFELTGKGIYLNELGRLWNGFAVHWADTAHGEWHPQLNRQLQPAGDTNKGDIWRSLYHSTRACVAMKHGFTALEGPNNTKLNNPETHPGPTTDHDALPVIPH